jgi:hypothetical protein
MMKATVEEISEAIAFAQQTRAKGYDQHHLIKVLLDYHDQINFLLPVVEAVERYFRSGQSEQEHANVMRSLDALHQAQAKRAHRDDIHLGLD